MFAEFVPWAQSLIQSWGYFGVFVVSVVGSASIILPLPSFAVIFFAGVFLNPFLVGIFSAFGSTVGEMFSYGIGLGGNRLVKRYRKKLEKGKKWMYEQNGFLLVLVFSATPLPDDVVGITCGVLKYDWRKFFLACFIGKVALHTFLALGGFYTISWMFGYFNW